VAIGVAVWIIPGIEILDPQRYLAIGVIALFGALINVSIKPLAQILALPLTVLTFGVFYLVINTGMLYLAAWLANSIFNINFVIEGFMSAFLASIVISIVTVILNALTGANNRTDPS
jgi:putative membrane protein